jgi:subfamily B ATP-binding cassette protein MsbA
MQEQAEAKSAKETYFRLLGYLRGNRGYFALGVVGMLMFVVADGAIIGLLKPFIDKIINGKNISLIVWVPLALIGIFLIRGAGDFIQIYFMGHVGRRIIKQLRAQIFDRLLDLPVSYFDRNASAIMLSRVIYNTEQIATAVTDAIATASREFLAILFRVGTMFYIAWKLSIVVFIVGPIIAALISIINKMFRRYSRRIQDSVVGVTRVAKEALDAPRVIKVFNAQDYERKQFDIVNEYNRKSSMKLLRVRGLANPVVQFVAVTFASAVLYIGIKQVVTGEISSGAFFAFFAALLSMMNPLRSMINVSGSLQQGIAAADSLFEILDEPVEPSSGNKTVERVKGDVKYRDVSFNYQAGNKAALNNVSLKVEAGSTVALVGRSGSGKSTLVNLLPRFYELDQGVVLVDGHDIRDYDLHSLREQIALVSQDVVLFDDSIRNNIAFGRPASNEAIERAAKAAHVLEFANQLPHGLETTVGERGVLLSGGQKQRISIARALLKNAPILILDEATSALDTESERVIQAALEDLMQNRTTLVIAHRLSTIEKADCIVVMDSGRIVEQGTHAELIAANGAYAALHRMQFNV